MNTTTTTQRPLLVPLKINQTGNPSSSSSSFSSPTTATATSPATSATATSTSSSSSPSNSNSNTNNNDVIRLATFNVLADTFPWFVESAILSPLRFKALPREIDRIDPSVIGLNEVTRTSLNALAQDSALKQKGYYYCFYQDEQQKEEKEEKETQDGKEQGDQAAGAKFARDHGCALFSRFPIVQAFRAHIDKACAPVVAVVRLPPSISSEKQEGGGDDENNCRYLFISAIHTTAYAKDETRLLRKKQITSVKNTLLYLAEGFNAKQKISKSNENKNLFCILGDLNLHDLNEDVNVTENNFIDAFAETHWSLSQAEEEERREKEKKKENEDQKQEENNVTSASAAGAKASSPCPLLLKKVEEKANKDPGWTFDPEKNKMIPRYIPAESRQMRLDRILFLPGTRGVSLKGQTVIFGTSVVDKNREILLSDHYGLYQDVEIVHDNNPSSSSSSSTSGSDVCLTGCPLVRAFQEARGKVPNDRTGVSRGVLNSLHLALVDIPCHVGFLLKRVTTGY